MPVEETAADEDDLPDVEYVDYENEAQLEHVMNLVTKDLSEPYSSKSYYSLMYVSKVYMFRSYAWGNLI